MKGMKGMDVKDHPSIPFIPVKIFPKKYDNQFPTTSVLVVLDN